MSKKVCLQHQKQAIAAPSVFFYKKIFHMIFCYRGLLDYHDGLSSYRLGYAYSKNGKKWFRDDRKLNHSAGNENEWDSKMQCYPKTILKNNKLYLFYNGNSFGETGIGLSVASLKY